MLGDAELVVVGLSHHTAPVELRERLAMPAERVGEQLDALRAEGLCSEGLILSTCNRVEVYGVVSAEDGGPAIARHLARVHGLRPARLDPHLYRKRGVDAVAHLFKVACSIDSLVVGEPQILGQVKQAFRLASERRAVGRFLGPLLRRTLSVAKRVRTETRIGQEAVSVGSAGVELARQVLGRLDARRALLVGTGDMGRLVATAMLGQGVGELIVANRTYARAVELARAFGGTAVHLDQLASYLERVDIVITATASSRYLLTRQAMAPVLRARRYKPLFIVDLSVPRNIDPGVHELEGAYLFNVDDLHEVARRGLERRQDQAVQAVALIEREAARAWRSLEARSADPVIASIVGRAHAAREAELRRSAATLATLNPEQREVVEAMTRAMFKRFLHEPLLLARRLAEEGDEEGLRLLAEAMGVGEAGHA